MMLRNCYALDACRAFRLPRPPRHTTFDGHPPAALYGRAIAGPARPNPRRPYQNLFLKDKKDALFLVTALEDATIELKSLHRRLNASGRFSFGSANLMLETLGITPGAVTPFGALNDISHRVTIVLDKALMAHATINAHPLVNTMTTSISREGLLAFLASTGHNPRIEPVAEPTAD